MKCKAALKDHPGQQTLKSAVSITLKSTDNEQAFKRQLAEQGINTVVRRNDTGRIYGITFIDHNSRAVWNGSRLGKELSANIFNDYWNHNIKPDIKESVVLQPMLTKSFKVVLPEEKPHVLFNFLPANKHEEGLIEAFGGFLPEAQREDYEEQTFASQMKKKRRKLRK